MYIAMRQWSANWIAKLCAIPIPGELEICVPVWASRHRANVGLIHRGVKRLMNEGVALHDAPL